MKKIITKQLARSCIAACALVFGTLSVVAPVSCRLTEEGLEIVPADTAAPAVEEFTVLGSDRIFVSCSKKIVLDNISVVETEADDIIADYAETDYENVFATAESVTYDESGKSAEIVLTAATSVGKNYIFSGIVYDEAGNSLEFSHRFCGYNEEPAKLLISEVRYNKSSSSTKTKKTEFIEFYVLESGNLAGLEVVSATNSEKKKYSFPSINVKRGEYIVLHGQLYEEMGATAIDELGEDLTLSTAHESCATARELWRKATDKFISQTDVIMLRESSMNKIKDAVLLSTSGKVEWTKSVKAFAEKVQSAGVWEDALNPDKAVCTDVTGTSTTSCSVSRQNIDELAMRYADGAEVPDVIPTCASDWLITIPATPGFENSSNPYVK